MVCCAVLLLFRANRSPDVTPLISTGLLGIGKIIAHSTVSVYSNLAIKTKVQVTSASSGGCCARILSRACACSWRVWSTLQHSAVPVLRIVLSPKYQVRLTQDWAWQLPLLNKQGCKLSILYTTSTRRWLSIWSPGSKRTSVGRVPMSNLPQPCKHLGPHGWFRRTCAAFCAMASLADDFSMVRVAFA